MASKNDLWNLVLDHRYSEAASKYETVLKSKPRDAGALGGHATAMLCLGNLTVALDEFRLANEVESNDLRKIGGKSQPYLTKIGTVLWLLGQHKEAVATFRAGVQGILDGSIEFGDNAGGATHGLLLWYASLSLKDQSSKRTAVGFLGKVAASNRAKYWPGLLAVFAVSDEKEGDMLMQLCKTADPTRAVEQAKLDLLARRRLSRALFYIAVRKRAKGDEGECREWMQRCAGMENPVLEPEWYLARGEVGHIEPWRHADA